jgi:hypothetical protein
MQCIHRLKNMPSQAAMIMMRATTCCEVTSSRQGQCPALLLVKLTLQDHWYQEGGMLNCQLC